MQWVTEDPTGTSQIKRTRSGPRRSHTKSRNGCQPCKLRRIKCGEERPQCLQCHHRGVSCIYAEAGSDGQPARTTIRRSPSLFVRKTGARWNDERSHIQVTFAPTSQPQDERYEHKAQLLKILSRLDVPRHDFVNPVYKQEDNDTILTHFLEEKSAWIQQPEVQAGLQTHGLRMAIDAPHLMYAIMAFSACHLAHLHPDEPKWEIAQTVHYSLSLQNLAVQLNKPVTAEAADACYASCFIQTMLAFYKQGQETPEEEQPYRWMRICLGVSTVQRLDERSGCLHDSIWYNAFLNAGGTIYEKFELEEDPKAVPCANSVMERVEKFCNIDVWSPKESHIFVEPLRHLSKLLRVNASKRAVGSMMLFNGHMSSHCISLLEQGDPTALLIHTFWNALMCDVKQWWAETQAQKECRRLCRILIQSGDETARHLLKFPLVQCGLIPFDKDDITSACAYLNKDRIVVDELCCEDNPRTWSKMCVTIPS